MTYSTLPRMNWWWQKLTTIKIHLWRESLNGWSDPDSRFVMSSISWNQLIHKALDFYKQYKKNKKRCGRRKIVLSKKQQGYIQGKVAQGWKPDVINGREEMAIDCSPRPLHRLLLGFIVIRFSCVHGHHSLILLWGNDKQSVYFWFIVSDWASIISRSASISVLTAEKRAIKSTKLFSPNNTSM